MGKVDDQFTIPIRLPGLNEIIDAAKANKHVYAKLKETYTDAVVWSAKGIKPFEAGYLDITWYEPHRQRDTDNIAAGKKFIMDGLQKAGIIKNDGWEQILGFTDAFAVDKENPRVEVVIRYK